MRYSSRSKRLWESLVASTLGRLLRSINDASGHRDEQSVELLRGMLRRQQVDADELLSALEELGEDTTTVRFVLDDPQVLPRDVRYDLWCRAVSSTAVVTALETACKQVLKTATRLPVQVVEAQSWSDGRSGAVCSAESRRGRVFLLLTAEWPRDGQDPQGPRLSVAVGVGSRGWLQTTMHTLSGITVTIPCVFEACVVEFVRRSPASFVSEIRRQVGNLVT